VALPPAAVLDTSVLLRLFHPHQDPEQAAADAIAEELTARGMEPVLLDLSVYELINVVIRRLNTSEDEAIQVVDALYDLGLPVYAVDMSLARRTASITAVTGLSGYDAAFVAAGEALALPLVTADRKLVRRAKGFDVRHLGDVLS
jgi:predicted nucleic acid-binding protein